MVKYILYNICYKTITGTYHTALEYTLQYIIKQLLEHTVQ